MPNLRFAPDFSIGINGQTVPAALRASATSVTFESGLEGSARVEIDLVNENLRWLDHSLLKLDNDLVLRIGYNPDPLVQVFAGQIVGHDASFPASGVPTIRVVAQDRMQNLQEGTKTRWFAIPIPTVGNFALPDTAVASIVSLENALIPIMDPVGAALSVLLGGVGTMVSAGDTDTAQKVIRHQAEESDYDFLERISKENGWEMIVDHSGPLGGHQLHFFCPLNNLNPDVTLKYGQSLIEFTPRISKVGQLASVTAMVWVAAIKTQFAVSVGWDWDRMSLSLDIRPSFTPMGSGPSDLMIKKPVTLVSAPREIISELIPKLNKRLTGTGSTIGDPRIRPGIVMKLEGLGSEFGGYYRVTSATHTIDSNGYRTSFEVRKEIWFGSIPLLEQGSVPLTIKGPFGG
jgi:phage protein D